MKEILNKQLRNELKKLGLEHVHLIKGNGYFYITSDIELYSESSIYLNSFNQQSVKEWVKDIIHLIKGTYK